MFLCVCVFGEIVNTKEFAADFGQIKEEEKKTKKKKSTRNDIGHAKTPKKKKKIRASIIRLKNHPSCAWPQSSLLHRFSSESLIKARASRVREIISREVKKRIHLGRIK